jgi:hypothetical protein
MGIAVVDGVGSGRSFGAPGGAVVHAADEIGGGGGSDVDI